MQQTGFNFDAATNSLQLPSVPAPAVPSELEAFRCRYPKAVAEFNRRALAAKIASDCGARRKGAKGICEDMREAGFTISGQPFAVNNNLTPLFARLAMVMESTLAGYFETRPRK
jgi:hypothetical protein